MFRQCYHAWKKYNWEKGRKLISWVKIAVGFNCLWCFNKQVLYLMKVAWYIFQEWTLFSFIRVLSTLFSANACPRQLKMLLGLQNNISALETFFSSSLKSDSDSFFSIAIIGWKSYVHWQGLKNIGYLFLIMIGQVFSHPDFIKPRIPTFVFVSWKM